MRKLLIILALLLPITALAQTGTDCGTSPGVEFICNPVTGQWDRAPVLAQAGETTPAAAAAAADDEKPPKVGEIITDAGKVIDDWKNIGWLAGVIAFINFLLNLIRFTPIESWLLGLDYKWIKPLIATLLGAALGGFSSLSTGASVLQSVITGAMAGLGSVGFHELIDKSRKRTTKAEG